MENMQKVFGNADTQKAVDSFSPDSFVFPLLPLQDFSLDICARK